MRTAFYIIMMTLRTEILEVRKTVEANSIELLQ